MFRSIKSYYLVLLMLLSFKSLAIVNIENMHKDNDAPMQAEINFNLSGAAGNSD